MQFSVGFFLLTHFEKNVKNYQNKITNASFVFHSRNLVVFRDFLQRASCCRQVRGLALKLALRYKVSEYFENVNKHFALPQKKSEKKILSCSFEVKMTAFEGKTFMD